MPENTMNPPVRDARQSAPRDLNTPVQPPRFTTEAAWRRRRADLRGQILNAAGLLPLPEKMSLRARIFGRIERDGYTVEKVALETMPGLLLGGNLYRPRGRMDKKFPAVLTPHGHWARGRLDDDPNGSVPARCIAFARQGYVVFSYDMTGYHDTGMGLGHRSFGEGDPRAALWGVSVFGLQTWNSIRALDFLLSLPDVDGKRIGVTGESGGGTQTFVLTAIDDRTVVSAPVNMISLHMQGGCLCENAPGLRLDTSNVEIGAMTAPKPMLMVSATGDWTKNTPVLEGPAVRDAYRLFGAEDRLRWVQMNAGHNYNRDSREAVYAFFGKWLRGDGNPAHFKEQPYAVEPDADLRVFPDGKPPAEQNNEAALIAGLIADRRRQWRDALPGDAKSRVAFGQTFGEALRHSLGVEMPSASEVLVAGTGESLILGRRGRGERVEVVLHPARERRTEIAALLVGDENTALRDLLRGNGRAVLALKTFRFETPRDPRANFFTGYNRTELANRVQDVLTALAFLKRRGFRRIELVGAGRAGLWALLARAFAPEGIPTVCDVDGLDTGSDDAFLTDLWQPGLRRAGDFRTAAILAAPTPLWLHDTRDRFDAGPVAKAYRAGGGTLTISAERAGNAAIADWLVRTTAR